MNVYYQNKKASFLEPPPLAEWSSIDNIYDPMLKLRADFRKEEKKVTIAGVYDNFISVNSLCIGYTNATEYKLTTPEGTFAGIIKGEITIHDFDEIEIDSFTLELEGSGPLYLGHLFVGQKTVLPRFAVEPETGITLNSKASWSFGGQVFGMKRITLESFGASFPRLTSDEYKLLKEYVKAVQNIEPHIIDPYPGAREESPPMYATLNLNEVSLPKRNEDGFYYGGHLTWQEAR